MSKKLGLALLLAVALSLSLVSVAFAQGTTQKVFMADLDPLNRSGAHGHAVLQKDGRTLDTKIRENIRYEFGVVLRNRAISPPSNTKYRK